VLGIPKRAELRGIRLAAEGFIAFELDLMKAVLDQLVPSLDAMDGAPLTRESAMELPDAQGV